MKPNSVNCMTSANYRNIMSCKSKTGIRENDDYVMIPKKKYKRDRLIEKCFVGGLIAIALIKFFFNKPKFP